MDLQAFKKELLADGIIDAAEVQALHKELYADGIIDLDEANFLFELNDAVSGKNNDASWNTFFIQAITDFLLNDEVSPGEIDKEELQWLINKVKADGVIDGVEKQLLLKLQAEAKNFPAELKELL